MKTPDHITAVCSYDEHRMPCEGISQPEQFAVLFVPTSHCPDWEFVGMDIVAGDNEGGVVFAGKVVDIQTFGSSMRQYHVRIDD